MPAAAILIGSGPSLSGVAMERLAGFASIAFNRSWLAWEEWGFTPTWYACLDPVTAGLLSGELTGRVLRHPVSRWFVHASAAPAHPAVTPVRVDALRPVAALDRIADLGNVGAGALQILAALGVRRVLMLGVDGRYGSVRQGADHNHFRPDYALRDFPADDESLVRHYLSGWPVVARAAARWGIEVRNASEGTALAEFPVIGLEVGLDWLAQAV